MPTAAIQAAIDDVLLHIPSWALHRAAFGQLFTTNVKVRIMATDIGAQNIVGIWVVIPSVRTLKTSAQAARHATLFLVFLCTASPTITWLQQVLREVHFAWRALHGETLGNFCTTKVSVVFTALEATTMQFLHHRVMLVSTGASEGSAQMILCATQVVV